MIENTFEANHALYNPYCVPSRLSAHNPKKQAGAQAYSVDLADWPALVHALAGKEVDAMVEAKGKEHVVVPTGIQL
jgi:hypothetical protein